MMSSIYILYYLAKSQFFHNSVCFLSIYINQNYAKQDQEFEDGRMNNIPFPCGKFASSLRKQLFREHLGLLNTKEDINIDDAIIKSFYKDVWCARSKQNTEIYEEVFHCIPTDKVVNSAILKQYQEKVPLPISDPLLAQEMVDSIKVYREFLMLRV